MFVGYTRPIFGGKMLVFIPFIVKTYTYLNIYIYHMCIISQWASIIPLWNKSICVYDLLQLALPMWFFPPLTCLRVCMCVFPHLRVILFLHIPPLPILFIYRKHITAIYFPFTKNYGVMSNGV